MPENETRQINKQGAQNFTNEYKNGTSVDVGAITSDLPNKKTAAQSMRELLKKYPDRFKEIPPEEYGKSFVIGGFTSVPPKKT